jgi:hypothetical protein
MLGGYAKECQVSFDFHLVIPHKKCLGIILSDILINILTSSFLSSWRLRPLPFFLNSLIENRVMYFFFMGSSSQLGGLGGRCRG